VYRGRDIVTVKRHRKRSWVSKPDISTNPASSRDKKVLLSVFFSPSCPLHPLTASFLLSTANLVGCFVRNWSFKELGRNGDWWKLLQGLNRIMLFTYEETNWSCFLGLIEGYVKGRRRLGKREANRFCLIAGYYVVEMGMRRLSDYVHGSSNCI
jgi:hypothetical protein